MKLLSAALLFLSLLVSALSQSTSSSAADADLSSFVGCLINASSSYSSLVAFSSKFFYTRSDANFSSVLGSYIRNLQFATPTTPKPLAVVTPLAPNHVQATILCARNNSLQIRIRSGGHDYEGLSYISHVPFIILDLFNLRDIKIDLKTETALVQAGATLGELYYAISQQSNVHAFPAGVCFTIGAGDHFTGGGYGNLMRKFGLSVDYIVDATIVDVNGRILDRKGMGEDLFWAIRGGGAASFGVVLGYKINLVRVPEIVTVFKVPKTLEEGATDVVEQWQQLVADDSLDKELFIRIMPVATNSTVTVYFIGMFLGDSAALLRAVSTKFPLLGLTKEDVVETSWVKSTMFWYDVPLNTSTDFLLRRAPSGSSYLKRKSDYVQSPIPRLGLEAVWKKMIQLGGNVSMQFNPYGGRMAEISPSETPFPHRAGNLWLIQYSSNWKDAADGETRLDAINQLYDLMTPYVSKSPREAFLNYRDIDIGTNAHGQADFGYKYFKANFDRLIRIKAAVDPDNFFQYEQSIPTKSVV
uniref:FAD-binding PCMH-type domain-containing protein n=1 Tax=Kalanchoe fedtschenkoi TaxID=63787 RepID=A0A7N0RE93_KALFE